MIENIKIFRTFHTIFVAYSHNLRYNGHMKIFAERLMEMRKERGLSQATVARDLGVSLGIVCYWETNKSDPTATNIAKVARYFNVSADYLLGLAE